MNEPERIAAARGGDLDSFNRLVIAYQAQVYNLAYRIMGESDSAADAAQEAFIAAYKSLRGFRGGSFRSWLLRIVTNSCYDELRRRRRRPSTSLEAMTDSETGPEVEGDGLFDSSQERPEEAAERSELARAIEECLERLPFEFRAVAVLADVQGYDYGQISAVIGKPLGTVKSRLARARMRMRDCLQRVRELLPAVYRLEDEAVP